MFKGAASILAIDVRPADGMVYGVASDGNIVTIDVKSGQATINEASCPRRSRRA